MKKLWGWMRFLNIRSVKRILKWRCFRIFFPKKHFILLYCLELFEFSLIIFTTIFALWYWVEAFIPNISEIEKVVRRPYIRVLDADKNLIASYGEFYAEPIEVDKLPVYVINALLDTEDRRFFQHAGFDAIGIMRAFSTNMKAGRVKQGGSTLTQQLAKNFLVSQGVFGVYDQSLQRKIYEVVLARMLETLYTKKQILSFYLNRVYFGAGVFGIAAAAEKFFNKHAYELNVYEAARIVGVIQAPSRYMSRKDKADQRALWVIEKMLQNHHITEKDKELAIILAQQPEIIANYGISRYFSDWILQCIPAHIFTQADDITVHTTLDPVWQEIAEKQAKLTMEEWGPLWGAESAAFVACATNGAVKAMIGGLDYSKSKFNMAANSLRQPGSYFKLFVYMTALERGFNTQTIMIDEPLHFKNWSPRNVDHKFRGPLTLEAAFARSINTISIKLTDHVSPKAVIDMAQRFHVVSPLPNNLTLALGTGETTMLEMITPLLTLVNQGNLRTPYAISKIENTKTGEVLYKRYKPKENTIINGKVVNSMLDLLEACVQYGSGRAAGFLNKNGAVYHIAGKTGTTQNERDKWFGGFSPHAVAIARFSTNKLGMTAVPGKSMPIRLWRQFMAELHERQNYPISEIEGADEDSEINNGILDKTGYNQLLSDIVQDHYSHGASAESEENEEEIAKDTVQDIDSVKKLEDTTQKNKKKTDDVHISTQDTDAVDMQKIDSNVDGNVERSDDKKQVVEEIDCQTSDNSKEDKPINQVVDFI